MSDNIFETQADPAQVAPVVVPSNIPVLPPEVAALVGEGRKYATVEAALAAVPHAQNHISKLEQELATLRSDLEKRKTTQELLEALKTTTPETVPQSQGVGQEQIAQMVEQMMQQNEKKKSAQANLEQVTSKFKEVYGDKAKDELAKLSMTSGLPVEELSRMAAIAPQSVLQLAGLTNKQAISPAKTTGTINTQVTPGTHQAISAKVEGTSTKDLVDAWKRAGEKARQNLGLS